jgi:DNA-binding MarR family transcriptional regulator
VSPGGAGAKAGPAQAPVAPAENPAGRRPLVEDLHCAVSELLGTERRLRGRDHNRAGALTHAQLRVLAALGREQELTAGQLARRADLNPASITAMLDHLEASGILERRRSTEDRRVYNVSLTPDGRRLLERKLAYWQSLWDEQLAEVDDRDLEAAGRVIHRLAGIYRTLCERLDAEHEAGSA